MTLYGLVYLAVPRWRDGVSSLIRAHFRLTVIGTIGVCVNGTIGYEVLSSFVQPDFYYRTIYGAGSCVFFYVLMKYTSYDAMRQ